MIKYFVQLDDQRGKPMVKIMVGNKSDLSEKLSECRRMIALKEQNPKGQIATVVRTWEKNA
jgi:hypothetical protein